MEPPAILGSGFTFQNFLAPGTIPEAWARHLFLGVHLAAAVRQRSPLNYPDLLVLVPRATVGGAEPSGDQFFSILQGFWGTFQFTEHFLLSGLFSLCNSEVALLVHPKEKGAEAQRPAPAPQTPSPMCSWVLCCTLAPIPEVLCLKLLSLPPRKCRKLSTREVQSQLCHDP
jgi:hypothetical protein